MRALLVAVVITACTGNNEPEPEPQPQPQPQPLPQPEPETLPTRYELVTEIDITASALLPQMAYEYYDLLRLFRDDPSAALIAVLDLAGVPLVDDLFSALPSSLQSRVKGWVNDYVTTHVYEGTPVGEHLDRILDYGEMALSRVELLSRLDLSTTPARHVVTALRFHIAGETIDVAIPSDAPAPFAFDVTVEARVSGDSLELGDHSFGIEYGKLAWAAFEEAVRRHYGQGVRETLGQIVDCPALAQSVATRCYLGVCVGHADDLEAICDAGLDELVAQMQEKVEGESFDAVRFQRGTAVQRDRQLVDGVWTAEIDLGQGPRQVPATFSGIGR